MVIVCQECKAEFDHEPLTVNGREMFRPKFCKACCDAQEARQTASEREARVSMRNNEWERICPPLYRETDISRIPAVFRTVIAGWKFNPAGLGLVGEAGRCKTRAAFMILKAQHFSGRRVFAASANKMGSWAQSRFSDDPERKVASFRGLQDLRRADVVLIDDLGKKKMTETVEEEFFDILEHRTSHCLPVIWTANAGAKELRQMLSPDRGDPIMRRLTEFSEIISAK
jgi:hypothetical protein